MRSTLALTSSSVKITLLVMQQNQNLTICYYSHNITQTTNPNPNPHRKRRPGSGTPAQGFTPVTPLLPVTNGTWLVRVIACGSPLYVWSTLTKYFPERPSSPVIQAGPVAMVNLGIIPVTAPQAHGRLYVPGRATSGIKSFLISTRC